MKITAIETTVVNAIYRNWIFVKVLTDQSGLYGWGEATLEWKTRAVLGAVNDMAPFVIGEDPRRVEHVYNRMTRFSFWPLGSIGLTAASGSSRRCGTSRRRTWAFRSGSCWEGPSATRSAFAPTSAAARLALR